MNNIIKKYDSAFISRINNFNHNYECEPGETRHRSCFKGPSGPRGPRGHHGPSGPKGSRSIISGPSGPSGPSGSSGSVGPSGSLGPSGPSGQFGMDSIVPGPSGPSGPLGLSISGPSGMDSIVPGPSGPSGPSGSFGPSGSSGPSGENSTVPGPSGPSGPSGSTGLSITGPSGPSGENSIVPGPSGPSGSSGSPGGIFGGAYFYDESDYTLATGTLNDHTTANVVFNQGGDQFGSSGITVNTTTDGTQFTLLAGTYAIDWLIRGTPTSNVPIILSILPYSLPGSFQGATISSGNNSAEGEIVVATGSILFTPNITLTIVLHNESGVSISDPGVIGVPDNLFGVNRTIRFLKLA
ncbi:MAG: hypothetical protein Terrestrivirus1_41 [Terrestrivirus sp.]|uniref:Uncharacterized protein n=1 Tax=Terrestrivirus sp. TaxID=2487775 RepID=A0A3G4ZK03_9VIRU|nr:MAG: hypothetical protein Terrestrivirus1_41 [Terrestrivirus sp.]